MKKYLKYLVLIGLIGFAFGFYQYNRPHQQMTKITPDLKIDAKQLFQEFEENETLANAKYLDKIVEVTGEVSQVNTEKEVTQLTLKSENLMFGVICELEQKTSKASTPYRVGDLLSIKGKCTGMLSDVILVRCVVL